MKQWLEKYEKTSIVRRAYNFALNAHKDSVRASGDPYITHCVAVAGILKDWKLDDTSIAAALLHDVVEDTAYTVSDLSREFGEEISFLVQGVTKLKNFKYSENPDVENLRRLFISFAKDLRVILIKLADRYHNMQTLKYKSQEKQKEIAWETIEIYAPIAYRLGIQRISGELEDLAFPYLYPEEYDWIIKNVKDRYEEREKYAALLIPALKKILRDAGVAPFSVDSRAKRYYSLYRKLLRYDMNVERIYDLVALRVIVKTVEECYSALGAIHKNWPPLLGRFKDYIALSKPNGYRSLHTTVSALKNKITEIQIRTEEMHEENELGIAAHWIYEQVKKGGEKWDPKWKKAARGNDIIWISQLRNWQKTFSHEKDLLEALKIDFFKERIFVVTPKNDVVDLPSGSTPVDFAYRIHSEIGNQCVGAKVNGKIVPLDYVLNSGDMVEILIQKGKKPSEDWLYFIKTSMAKKHVKNYIRKKMGIFAAKHSSLTEFKIINSDRPGFLKDVTSVFGDQKINITYLNSQTDARQTFSTITIRCQALQKQKIEKTVLRLKKIEGIQEITHKVITVP